MIYIITPDNNDQGWLDSFNEWSDNDYKMHQEITEEEHVTLNITVRDFNERFAQGPAIALIEKELKPTEIVKLVNHKIGLAEELNENVTLKIGNYEKTITPNMMNSERVKINNEIMDMNLYGTLFMENTPQNNRVTLKFFISTINILNMDVDLKEKTAIATNTVDEDAVWPILAKNERNYVGLEKRLQIFMQSKHALPELIDDIEKHNIHVDYHHNLNIEVIR